MLSKHPDHCRFPHGHSRRVEFILEAVDLDSSDMVCDFKIIKHAIGAWLDQFDHSLCVNTDDPAYEELKARYGDRVIGFPQQDPTTEVMAKRIFDHTTGLLREYAERTDIPYPLRASVRLVAVKLWETSSSWAEYFIH